MMTVGQLRAALAGLPDDRQVVMSRDREGNEFRPLDSVEDGVYRSRTRYAGDFWAVGEYPHGQAEPDAVCLWPVI